MNWLEGSSGAVKVLSGGTLEIGTLNAGNGLVTFTDGSSVSLDLGL
jgi:alpha-acetolactate decarboxylase